ncbi:MAG: hypothetical protein ABJA64_01515, partial [Candidatus Saccharibacteria bacterium]
MPTKEAKVPGTTHLRREIPPSSFLVVCETHADRRHCRVQTVLDDPGKFPASFSGQLTVPNPTKPLRLGVAWL